MNKKPNIVLILTDQQRYDTIGILGNKKISTPNIDSLVENGVVFTRCYSASPECVPARISIKTGLYPWVSGSTSNKEGIPPSTTTIMKILLEHGYHTQAIGKMHFIPKREPFGFKRMWLAEELAKVEEDDYMQFLVKNGYGYVEEPNGMRSYMYYIPQVSQLPKDMTSTAWIGRKSIEYIEEMSKEKLPFFLWIGFIKPHPPFDPPVPYNWMYEPTEMDEPIVISDSDIEENYTYWNYKQNRYKWMESMRDVNFIKIQKAFYFGCISFIDEQIGLIIETLKRNKLLENTIIIFTSDHGEYLGDYWCFGKRGFQDCVARVPFVISWIGNLPKGEMRDGLVGHIDIMPTILQLCGIEFHDNKISGIGLLNQILKDNALKRSYFFGQYNRREKALYLCMDTQWKYIYDVAGKKEFLYNYIEDPREIKNFAKDENYKKIKERLKKSLIEKFKEDGNKEAIEGEDFKSYENQEYEFLKNISHPNVDFTKKGRLYQFPPGHPKSVYNKGKIF